MTARDSRVVVALLMLSVACLTLPMAWSAVRGVTGVFWMLGLALQLTALVIAVRAHSSRRPAAPDDPAADAGPHRSTDADPGR